MPCFNNNCRPINNCDQPTYPVYPSYRYPYSRFAPFSVNCNNHCCHNGCNGCNGNGNGNGNGFNGVRERVFKSATIGTEEVRTHHSIPFNFNTFDKCHIIEHFEHDTNFTVLEDGLYEVTYKVNFVTPAAEVVDLVLRKNSVPINETHEIITTEAGKFHSASFSDILCLQRDSVIDLFIEECPTSPVMTVTDPIITFRKLD